MWRILPDCEDDDDAVESLEIDELHHDLRNTDILQSLMKSIDEAEKRWRQVRDNFGRRDCGKSRSTYYQNKESKESDDINDRK